MTKIIDNIFNNLSLFVTINFTLIAFILTAITILLMINRGIIKEFKEHHLLQEVIKKFKFALDFNFLSGIIGIIGIIFSPQNDIIKGILSFSLIFFFLFAIYFAYKTYIWILFFIKNS